MDKPGPGGVFVYYVGLHDPFSCLPIAVKSEGQALAVYVAMLIGTIFLVPSQ